MPAIKLLSTNSKKKPSDYTFKNLDQELLDLNELLQRSNIDIDGRANLFKPILEKISTTTSVTINKKDPLQSKHLILYHITYIIICFILLMLTCTWWENLYWHITALIRIAMVKILPYWDWRYLKNEICLIPKFDYHLPPEMIEQNEQFDCDLCENLKGFQDLSSIEQTNEDGISDLIRQCVQLEIPVMINGKIDHWLKESPQGLINELLKQSQLAHSIPCNLCTNIHNSKWGDIDLLDLFEKTQLFNQFFIHFQNCEPKAMKMFRNFTSKPSIIPDELSPVTYNWLIWNSKYDSIKYRKLYLIEKHTLIGQIFGTTHLKLLPRNNCKDVCPILKGDLKAGYLIVLTSLWDVEYLPNGEQEEHNMAAILELKTGVL